MRFSRERRRFLKLAGLAAGTSLLPSSFNPRWLHAAEGNAQLAGWTSFRNGHANLGIADSSLPDRLEKLWEVEAADGTASTAVISNGRVYMGTLSGHLHCLDLRTGEEFWRYQSVEEADPNSFAPGFNAPAALDATAVFIGDDMGGFHAVERESGQRRWYVETAGEIVGGAQLVGNHVIFGSHDGHLYCHDVASGDRIWEVETHGPVNATPCLAGKFTFTTGCDKPILRVIDIEEGIEAEEVPIDSLMLAACAVREGILYFGTDSGTVQALDWEQKTPVWTFSVPNRSQQIHSSPAVTDKYVIIGSRDKNVYCLNRQTGERVWNFQTRAKVDSSPVVSGNRVYFGSGDRNLYALDLETGEEVWKENFGQSITGSPAIAEGCLVIGTDSKNGRILCFGQK